MDPDIPPARPESDPASARAILGPSPLVAIVDEPPARLIVDPPLAEQLSTGRVFIQYRTENLRLVPVFGAPALAVSPRIGHVHITVDDAPWHFIDASGDTVVLVGLKPGPHQVRFDLADPTHRVTASVTSRFVVPPGRADPLHVAAPSRIRLRTHSSDGSARSGITTHDDPQL